MFVEGPKVAKEMKAANRHTTCQTPPGNPGHQVLSAAHPVAPVSSNTCLEMHFLQLQVCDLLESLVLSQVPRSFCQLPATSAPLAPPQRRRKVSAPSASSCRITTTDSSDSHARPISNSAGFSRIIAASAVLGAIKNATGDRRSNANRLRCRSLRSWSEYSDCGGHGRSD